MVGLAGANWMPRMLRKALHIVALTTVLWPAALRAEPVTLTMSYFTSDRSNIYQCFAGPFVDAVNAAGAGIVEIKVVFSGAMSAIISDQPKLVRGGTADLAVIVPGYSPEEFPDTSVLQLPGLYLDNREASLIYARLAASGALTDYRPYMFIGGFVSPGEDIHTRKPLAGLSELKGRSIRVNNIIEEKTLTLFGATPLLLPINRTMERLNNGTLDGVTVPEWMVFEFGFGRLTAHHYLAELGGAVLGLVMNAEKFSSLSPAAQAVLKDHGGEWLAAKAASCAAAKGQEILSLLEADARRKVTRPSATDQVTLRGAYAALAEAWGAETPHNRALLAAVTAELAKLRKETPQ